MVRLYEAHRATTDFDEVTESRDETIELLLARGAVRTANGVLLPDRGVQLDLLDAGTTLRDLAELTRSGLAALDSDDERRAVQLALVCRYALETATATEIVVVDRAVGTEARRVPDGPDVDEDERAGGVVARVVLPVALAGVLVAMKVHAASQPERKPDKAAGDIYDAYRLVRAWGPGIVAEDLSRAPVVLLDTTVAQLDAIFGADVERSARKLRSASIPGVESVGVDELETVVAVIEALEPFRHWD
jgi:hypothetical protein